MRATNEQPIATPTRIVAFDRARTFITLLVLLHHSVVNYTHFGNGDKARWLGFDLVVLFNDSFFMACMFLISGLFVQQKSREARAYKLSRLSLLASRRAIPAVDLRLHADRLLSDLPALPSARH